MLRIHPEKCTGCMQCELACSYVQTGTFQPARSVIRVKVFDEHAGFSPYTCFQCNEAWCMTACPVNAIAINRDTRAKVVLDQACVGCGLCAIACPFGTVFYNPDTHKAFKCNLCNGDPACAHACPTGAIEYAEIPAPDWVEPWAEKVHEAFLETQERAGAR
ncbi:MAG: 4Fe-4S dicluster domain-containing protein [Deltaproteobacteria bacterium]|nr:4Fe-4S dicluster domain-containing protein [Deltaproteobacteria bacterium]